MARHAVHHRVHKLFRVLALLRSHNIRARQFEQGHCCVKEHILPTLEELGTHDIEVAKLTRDAIINCYRYSSHPDKVHVLGDVGGDTKLNLYDDRGDSRRHTHALRTQWQETAATPVNNRRRRNSGRVEE